MFFYMPMYICISIIGYFFIQLDICEYIYLIALAGYLIIAPRETC